MHLFSQLKSFVFWFCFLVTFSSCWMSPSSSRESGVSGGQALPSSEFLVYVSSTSCYCAIYCMLHKTNTNSNRCLLSELLSAFTRVRHTRSPAGAHPLQFEVSRSSRSQCARCFLLAQVQMWNDLPYSEFDTGMLEGFKGAVNCWLLAWIIVLSSVFRGAGACGVAKAIHKYFFPHLGLCCRLYNFK